MHRMQPQQHRAAEFDTTRGFDDIQGTYVESCESEVAAAATATTMATTTATAMAEGHGSDLDEVSGGAEREEGGVEEDEDEKAETTPHNTNEKANDHSDPEAWRQRIDLRAVECCGVGVQLATPPFPFDQRWDLEGYQLLQDQRKKREKKEKKKRKRAAEERGRAEKKRRASPDYTVGGSAWRSGM
jgi:hypothetical protein